MLQRMLNYEAPLAKMQNQYEKRFEKGAACGEVIRNTTKQEPALSYGLGNIGNRIAGPQVQQGIEHNDKTYHLSI